MSKCIFTPKIILSILILVIIAAVLYNSRFKTQGLSSVIINCQNTINWRECYGSKLAIYNKNHNFSQTLLLLFQAQDKDPKTRDCHLIAHRLAISEVEKDPGEWIDIFNSVQLTACNGGFIHGALEGVNRYDHSFNLDASNIPTICSQIDSLKNSKSSEQFSVDEDCFHALGHILLAEAGGDITKAVFVCDQLSSDLNQHCYQGVFMENITRENLLSHGLASPLPKNIETVKQIEKLCLGQKGKAALGCFRELPHIYTFLAHNNPKQVYELCDQAPLEEERRECYLHGVSLMIVSDDFDDKNLGDLCINYLDGGDHKLAMNCIYRSLSDLIGSSVKFTDRAIKFCEALPENYQESCFNKIKENINIFGT